MHWQFMCLLLEEIINNRIPGHRDSHRLNNVRLATVLLANEYETCWEVVLLLICLHDSCLVLSRSAREAFLGVYIKGKFLHSAVSSPKNHSKRFTLYFPDRPVHPDTISASLGSIQPCVAITARRLLVHISATVYSQVLIYTAE